MNDLSHSYRFNATYALITYLTDPMFSHTRQLICDNTYCARKKLRL